MTYSTPRKSLYCIILALLFLLPSTVLAAPSEPEIKGKWEVTENGTKCVYEFLKDGVVLASAEGTTKAGTYKIIDSQRVLLDFTNSSGPTFVTEIVSKTQMKASLGKKISVFRKTE